MNFTGAPDFYIVTKDGKFGVDLETLKKSSDVFMAMWEMRPNKNDNEIELDEEPKILIDVLKYLHGNDQPQNYKEIVLFAYEYNIVSLINYCEKGILEQDVFDEEILKLADTCHLEVLKKQCIKVIACSDDSKDVRNILRGCSKDTLVELEMQRRVEFSEWREREQRFLDRMSRLYKHYNSGSYFYSSPSFIDDFYKMGDEYKNDGVERRKKKRKIESEMHGGKRQKMI